MTVWIQPRIIHCLDCGELYNETCKSCHFVVTTRDVWGSSDHADRMIHLHLGKAFLDRLVKHESKRDAYMKAYKKKIEEMTAGLRMGDEFFGLTHLTSEQQQKISNIIKNVDYRFIKLENGEIGLDDLD